MKQRESFSSRLGFLLISAGCAIGLGNVWRFPYITGQYGGAAFVVVYLLFLVIMGLPVMVMEFSVGRGSQKSMAGSFQALEPEKGGVGEYRGYSGAVHALRAGLQPVERIPASGGWHLHHGFGGLPGQ